MEASTRRYMEVSALGKMLLRPRGHVATVPKSARRVELSLVTALFDFEELGGGKRFIISFDHSINITAAGCQPITSP